MPLFINYDYGAWRDVWRAIRHAMIGEVEIKRHGRSYLPRPDGMDDDQYRAYLDRAVFYNMVYRTVTGLTGSIFRRDPRILKAGPKLTKLTKRVSKDGLSLTIFTKVIAQDMLSTGRYGVLVDKAPESVDRPTQPYLAGYTCENILDWTEADIDGRTEVDYVLLREFKTDRRFYNIVGTDAVPNPTYGQFFAVYRALRLVQDDDGKWEYVQEVYERDNEDADLTETPIVTTPMIFGVPMRRLPFKFFNATTSGCGIEKPPVLDILTLNMAHYKVYAQLMHGRFYTANPIYVVSGSQEDDEYHIGPSVVWEIGAGEKAQILEYNGQGLKSLEGGLGMLETQVASLGGRLIGDSNSAGQSENQIKMKDRNEQSLLLNVSTVINENITELLTILAAWLNENADDLQFRVNQDFLLNNAAAREFRAISQMYLDGVMPLDIIYEYFLKEEVIPEYVDLDTFRKMLEDRDQFPHQANVDANFDGYANATDRMLDENNEAGRQHDVTMQEMVSGHEASLQADELEFDADEASKDRDHEDKQKAKDRVNAVKVAEKTPKIAPVPGAARQANAKDPAGRKPNAGPAPKKK
jgi:hypothetical protein